MNLIQLLFDFFSGKAKTRVYTTFLGWLLIFHIDILFIAIFTDQAVLFEKTNQLKGEYVFSYFVHFGIWAIVIEALRLGLATLMTYLMIWVIPKSLNEKSYKEELDIEFRLRKMKVVHEEKLNQREESVVNQQLKNLEVEKEMAIERAKLEDTPEQVRWDQEFSEFMNISNGRMALREVSNTMYSQNGHLYGYRDGNGNYIEADGVNASNLALVDTNGLVDILDKGAMLSLTEKGKYFIKRLSSI
jgi:hypothetical protein